MRLSEEEHRLAAETSIKYRGTACIALEALTFAYEADERNVMRLKQLFKKNGCNRLDVRNHVPAVISQEQLDIAIRHSKTTAKALMDSCHTRESLVELTFPAHVRLQCLHGLDRVRAATGILSPAEKYWIVDLYLEDLSHELRTNLVEEYSCEKEPDDGEFYCKIRQYQKSQNVYFEERWWARLSSTSNAKAKNLRRLLNIPKFRAAFDCQLEIPGLRRGMRLSTLHTMFAMKCDEEILRYLKYVNTVWSRIARGDAHAMQKIDKATVKALELTAPGAFAADRRTTVRQVRNGQILANFAEREREAIWNEVLSVSTDRLIPSLFTFFEDINYLQNLADCVKQLVQLSDEDSLTDAIRKHYSGVNQVENQYVTQDAEFDFVSRPGALNDQVEFGMRQLWAAAGRKYVAIPVQRKKAKQDLLAKPTASLSETILYEFAALAHRLGFNSDKIQALRHRSTDIELARWILLEARKPSDYEYDANDYEKCAEQIAGFFCKAKKIPKETRSTFQDDDRSDKLPKRCGIPRMQDYEQDQSLLFLTNLHDYKQEDRGGQMTPFFIRRSVFLAFFGETQLSRQPLTEQESCEQEVFDGQRMEQERLGRERLERERLEREKLERDKLEREKLEREKLEREKLERERLERERLEREKLERDKLEREKLEREKLEREKLERERLERERLEREKLEREKLEREKLERERLERERLAQERDKLEQDRLAQERERLAQRRLEQREFAEARKARMPPHDESSSNAKVRITFLNRERGSTFISDIIEVDPCDPSEVTRVAFKYTRKEYSITNTTGQMLHPKTCFEEVTADGTNTILLIPRGSTIDTEELVSNRTSKRLNT